MAELTLNHHRGGSGEPMVLMHGIGSSWRIWKSVLPALEAEFDVLALDLPGFGQSPRLPEHLPASVPTIVDELERQLDAAGVEDPHLVGNSLGGWIALELARRGRARSVVALSPAGMWSPKEASYSRRLLANAYRSARLVAPRAELVTRTALGRTLAFWFALARPWRMDPEEGAHGIRSMAGAECFLETLEWMRSHQPEGLADIRTPVLIAWGTRDLLLFPRQGPRFVRHLPNAELLHLRGLGHVPSLDDPELVARTILDFARRQSREPSATASA